MPHNITVSFLGTTSGGGPTETRNCSSLIVDALGQGSLWMFDCAEGTVRQFTQQPSRPGRFRPRVGSVDKIFVTHMHADHTMGLLTLLRNVLGAPSFNLKPSEQDTSPPPNSRPPRVEIYGPRGLRRVLRVLWNGTHTRSEHSFAVHELLFPGELPSAPADSVSAEDSTKEDIRGDSECVGRDIQCDGGGFWRSIHSIQPKRNNCGVIVDAGPILHRDPCIGYIIREVPPMPLDISARVPRKLVILGDTFDPSPIAPLIHDDPAFALALPGVDLLQTGNCFKIPVSLLIHEATDAYIPRNIDPDGRTGKNRTQESVKAKTIERGHSTPEMAGAFARRIGAERLVLNHIGARFPALSPNQRGPGAKFRSACIHEIERQAAQAWDPRALMTPPKAAWDFLSIEVPPNQSRLNHGTVPNANSVTPVADEVRPAEATSVAAAEFLSTPVSEHHLVDRNASQSHARSRVRNWRGRGKKGPANMEGCGVDI